MMSRRRGTRVWLGILGTAVGLVVLGGLAGQVPPLIALMAGISYLVVAIAALTNLGPSFLRDRVQALQEIGPAVTIANRTTTAGRRAAQRARNRGEFSVEATLLDIGLMVNEQTRDGRWDRRLSDSIALDDQALQPFVKVHLAPGTAERLAVIDYEIYDQAGQIQFSHQQKHWVRDGENLIACEQQLPLRGNTALGRAGTWDLRVKVDGTLAGVHGFGVTPAQATSRPAATAADYHERRDRMAITSPDEADEPISLEQLLANQKRRNGSS
jgi:hypothetical protein